MAETLKKHPLIPQSVKVEIPGDRKETEKIRDSIKSRFDDWLKKFGPMPEHNPVNIQIHSERTITWFDGFRELYITYNGESGETIPAYLLIPLKGEAPFPAIVANHQCNVDCDVGKDAVVGKAYLRPDQAYGFELAINGFVVLAPDSINCGERNIKGLRNQGERDKNKCWDAAIPYLSVKSLYLKHLWDATRAVDVLENLDFVASNQIGMIGHSLGAGTTFWAAAFDTRIKASILSCHYLGGLGIRGYHQFYQESGNGLFYHELLALIAPRACLATRGRKEKPLSVKGNFENIEDENSVMTWAFNVGKLWCHLYEVSEDKMQVRFFDRGHEFPEPERKFAYEWLTKQLV